MVGIFILGGYGGLANQSDGDSDGTEQKRFTAADSVEEEGDEDQVCKRPDAVVDAGD